MDNEPETYLFEAEAVRDDRSGLSIHAGFPNPSDDAKRMSLDFNQLLVRHATGTFVFRVNGEDWRRFGVWHGDLAVVDRLLDPRPRDLIVWYREGQTGFGISHFNKTPNGTVVWGVVTNIIHQFRNVQ